MPKYPRIREALSSRYRDAPDAHIEALVRGTFGEVAPEDIENFFGSLANMFRSVAPALGNIVRTAAPAILPLAGTAIGGMFGVPQIGGMLGQMGGRLVGQLMGPPPGGAGGGAPAPGPAPAPQPMRFPPGGVAPAPQQPGPQPALQLATLFSNPAFLQAIQAAMFGAAGRESVTIAGESVPVSAMLNLHGVLADAALQARQAIRPVGENVPSYLVESSGENKCDVSSPHARAEVLWEMLVSDSWRSQAEPAEAFSWRESDEAADPEIDAYELARAYTGH